jgi:general secretion pathway protein K
VRGIPPAVVEHMLPFVTVFSNAASINILDAAPQVVAALPGMTPVNLQEVLSARGDLALDPHSLLALAGGEGATLAGSKAYRLTIASEADSGRRSTAEVVILLLEGGQEPYRVLSWRNASDGGSAPQRASPR